MTPYICVTCGTQFAATDTPPPHCPICEDQRQYVGGQGQQWTTLAALQEERRNEIREVESTLTGIGTQPSFAIGQRALLVETAAGNLLWDCISLIDAATVAAVQALGGIDAIAISHPHYYSCMVEWSRAFDAPIYLHVDDREHVMRPDPVIEFWTGETKPLFGGLTLMRCGGTSLGEPSLTGRVAQRGGRAAGGRHPHCRVGSALCEFYVQLSQPDSAIGGKGAWDRGCGRAV